MHSNGVILVWQYFYIDSVIIHNTTKIAVISDYQTGFYQKPPNEAEPLQTYN